MANYTFWVTGSTGCLGEEVTHRLEDLGAHPCPLVLPGYPLLPKRATWRAATPPIRVTNASDLDGLPTPDCVINLHWLVDRTLADADQRAYELDRNVAQLEFLWDWIRHAGPSRFLNVSSASVFGHLNESPISGASEPRPATPYGQAKLAAEQHFEALYAESPVEVAHVRLGPVSAPCEHPSRLMSGLYASAFQGARVRINQGHSTSGLYVHEAADLIIQAAATAPPGCYVLTGPPVTNEQAARIFEEVAGRALDAEYVDLAPGTTDPEFVSDIDQFSTAWTRRVEGREAARRFIAERAAGEASRSPETGADPSSYREPR